MYERFFEFFWGYRSVTTYYIKKNMFGQISHVLTYFDVIFYNLKRVDISHFGKN